MAHGGDDKQMNASLEAASNEVILDSTALDDIRSLDPDGSSGFLSEIVETFFRSTEQVVQDSRLADSDTDPDLIRKAVHYLKSSSGSIGGRRLLALCAQLEKDIQTGEATDVGRRLAHIRSVYHETRKALSSALTGGAA